MHSEETCDILLEYFGGVAHLGERLNGIQEVVGSIPIISTTVKGTTLVVPFCFCKVPLVLKQYGRAMPEVIVKKLLTIREKSDNIKEYLIRV